MEKKNAESNKQLLYKYAGFSTQLLVSLGLAVFAGWWIDKKINFRFPVAIWLFPLVVLLFILFTLPHTTGCASITLN
jgi:hypothetical protein